METITYTRDKKELKKILLKQYLCQKKFLTSGILILICGIYLVFQTGIPKYFGIVFLFVAITYPLLVLDFIRKFIKNNQDLTSQLNFHFDESGIKMETTERKFEMKWCLCVDWELANKYIYLKYRDQGLDLTIPLLFRCLLTLLL